MIISALLSLLAGLRGGNPLPFLVLSSNGNSFPPPLSRAEETELFRRARREGDEAAREKLIEVGTHEWIQAHHGRTIPGIPVFKGFPGVHCFLRAFSGSAGRERF